MPMYDYKCTSCQHEFSDILSVDDRNIPCESPCPKCGNSTVEKPMTTTGIVMDATKMNFRKKMDPKLKDRLQEIKSKYPGSTIDV